MENNRFHLYALVKNKQLSGAWPWLLLIYLFMTACSGGTQIGKMSLEYQEHPLSLQNKDFRLGWQILGSKKAIMQSTRCSIW